MIERVFLALQEGRIVIMTQEHHEQTLARAGLQQQELQQGSQGQAQATVTALPHSVDEFVKAQQWCLDNGRMLTLASATVLEFTQPVTFILRGTKFPTGLSAYGALFKWRTDGNWERTMLRYTTTNPDGQAYENQYFTLRGLTVNADQTGGSQASPQKVLCVDALHGAAIRGADIADVTIEGCVNGIWVEGEVFESYIRHPRLSWCRNAGIVVRHGYDTDLPPAERAVCSNIFISQPDITRCSQNMGAAMGIHADRCSSVIITDGNFISLDGPGIYGTNGLKSVHNCEFENVGNTNGAAIVTEHNDFVTSVIACRGSNTAGQMKVLLRHGPGADDPNLIFAHCWMYAGDLLDP